MKTIDELLSDLDRLGVKLWVDGNRLHYKAPEETLTPEILTQLQERRKDILEFLGKTKAAASSHFPPITPVSRNAVLPLSFSQEVFWFLEQLVPGNSFSNLITAIRLTGQLNVAALKQTFNEIVRRHEVLRTTFSTVEGQLIQVISPVQPLALLIEDLSELPEAEREAEFLRRGIQEFHRPFNFEQGPLLRVTLIRIGDEEYVLLQTMHHIISDTWSLQVLNREVAVLYEAFSKGCPSPLPELRIQYADFAVWQRQLLHGEILEAQLSYWKQKLQGGNLPPLKLPIDYPRPTAQSFRTSCQTIVLPKSLSEGLKSLGYKEGCTLFMMLLSAFKILLYSLTGQEHVRLGTVVANRNQSQIEGLIGLFINTLVLCTDLSGNPTFREVLQRVRNIVLEAYDNQDLPFEELVRTLERESNLKRVSLFQVMVLLDYAPPPPFKLSELTLQALDVKEMVQTNLTVTSFDLIFTFREKPEGLTGSLIYKTALFDGSTINRMLRQFQNIVEHIISQLDQPLSTLPPFPGNAYSGMQKY